MWARLWCKFSPVNDSLSSSSRSSSSGSNEDEINVLLASRTPLGGEQFAPCTIRVKNFRDFFAIRSAVGALLGADPLHEEVVICMPTAAGGGGGDYVSAGPCGAGGAGGSGGEYSSTKSSSFSSPAPAGAGGGIFWTRLDDDSQRVVMSYSPSTGFTSAETDTAIQLSWRQPLSRVTVPSLQQPHEDSSRGTFGLSPQAKGREGLAADFGEDWKLLPPAAPAATERQKRSATDNGLQELIAFPPPAAEKQKRARRGTKK